MARSALQGEITRISGEKTYRVTISYRKVHAKYRKIVNYKRSFLVHSENKHEVGEKVSIVPATKRISKLKHYIFVNDPVKVEAVVEVKASKPIKKTTKVTK